MLFLWERCESPEGFCTVSTGLRLRRKRGTPGREGFGFGLPSDEAAGSVKNGEGAIGIVVDADADLGAYEIGSCRMRRDLQPGAVPGDGVVGSDGALFLDAQEIAPLFRGHRHEGLPCFGGLGREAGVVGRNIGFPEKPVGGFDIADTNESELLRQPVLKGAEARSERPRACGE